MTSCTGEDGTTGTKYSYAQLEGLWINAGGPSVAAPLAAAIAMAESDGCSAAINPTDNGGTQTSWGLWQISNGTHNAPVSGIRNPATNAQQAVAKYTAAGGFSPWGTYTSGAYRQYINGSTTPDTSGLPTAASAGSGGSSSGSASDPGCLLQIGGGSFLGINNPLNVCLLSRTGAREAVGVLCIVGAGILGLAAAVILAASAFQHPAATAAVAGIAPVRGVVNAATPEARENRSLARRETAASRAERRRRIAQRERRNAKTP